MAAGRPIVSTPVPDVVRNFASLVTIASGKEEFLEGERAAVERPDATTLERAIERARRSSWESIVAEMSQRIDVVVGRRMRALRAARVATVPASGSLREAAVRRSP